MPPEVTSRYEQRIIRLSIQPVKTLRLASRIEWADYTTLMMRPCLNAFGHVDATEMYDARLSENRNGATEIQTATYNNDGVYFRTRPYFRAQQNATEIPTGHTSSTSTSRTTTSAQRTPPQQHRVVVWAAIRRPAIYQQKRSMQRIKKNSTLNLARKPPKPQKQTPTNPTSQTIMPHGNQNNKQKPKYKSNNPPPIWQ